ncbi:glutaminyl-peptide cyclotransferase [Winogradskyella echinorum]|uniref:Glutaminyl-peptide cyclotransferase n=1 Tax=Winogradskyella echinorum TaxID=538189 RepID=A0ABR6Y5K2_9FLAO|nr:glutaminyl-peptide cyclotransferase [Winogradskyella echinorum]MBC3847979.1 glutaminyl-peptide cyclotransferase [Winogradskyella echinorum]MBC5752327.1 glutaminyl-peptide cyclotransferase [Winogradskyella echinorum]
MRLSKYIILLCLSFILTNCGDTNSTKQNGLSINTGVKSAMLGDTINLSINNPKKIDIDNVSFQLDGQPISENKILNDITLGEKTITAIVKYGDETQTLTKTLKVFNNVIPTYYKYEVVNTYPHDITSYTQGLEFFNGELYESTGQKGESKLRKVNFETGEVLKNINLEDKYFGEGLTILNDKIYQLTWQAERGFVYNVNTFEKLSTFNYGKSKEGWGLCNDGKQLYKSDGTDKIWTLNPDNLTEEKFIQVYTEKGKIPSLNELEWIDGKIYANIYQRNGVVIINPKTGGVEGVIDFKPLRKLVKQHDELDVLNGIAYHPERQTIFVTGKNWDKLFEVKITK